MPCRILRSLYLRANGEIPCDDDFGEQMVLGWAPKNSAFSPKSLFNNEKYLHIVDSFKDGAMPWGRICDRCALNRKTDPPDNHLAQRVISYFQIETTLACSLKCPGCSRASQLKSRPGPHMLDLRQLQSVVSGLKSEGYVVHNIDYCGQGEPLDHPDFRKVADITRTAYPAAHQRIITNGNHSYASKLSGVFVEELMVSIDGATQASYEQYRIGGNLEKAITFTRDAKVADPKQKVVWKYILFDHNDSIEEIAIAEKLAQEIGVDSLQFVRTHSAGKSIEWENRTLPLKWVHSVDTSTPLVERMNLD